MSCTPSILLLGRLHTLCTPYVHIGCVTTGQRNVRTNGHLDTSWSEGWMDGNMNGWMDDTQGTKTVAIVTVFMPCV